jgi:hypothetical protein
MRHGNYLFNSDCGISTKLQVPNPNNQNPNFPLTPPSPPRGEGKGEGGFGHLKLIIGIYLGFGIWTLEFEIRV